jgi:hypothetical protein
MLYLLSGAPASGKKTVARVVTSRFENLVSHHEHELPAMNRTERMANMERWIERALALEAEGQDLLLLGATPLGELLASPRAPELSGIAACLLDCHDHERRERYVARGVDPRWPFGMDFVCWASFHRMHAIDSTFEQRVLWEPTVAHYHWDRWTRWPRGDARWSVEIIDTSGRPVSDSVDRVASWIARVRASGTALTRTSGWWN